MSTENISAIDEKKAEEKGNNTEKADWKGFLTNFSGELIIKILTRVILIGSIGLFLAKAANANVFPTENNMQPYKDIKRDLNIEITYMNPVKIFPYYGLKIWANPEKYWIQEANFFNPQANINFMDKFFETWLCSLQKKETSFWLCETDVLQNMMSMSFTIISTIFFNMNYLPEWLTMIVFGKWFLMIIYIIYLGNFIYGSYAHVIKFIELIKYTLHPNPDPNIKPLIVDYPGIIMYVILYFWAMIISVILSPVFITIYTLFKALSVNYIVRKKNNEQNEPNKSMNLYSFIKNIFYYKKTFIVILTMIKLILSANNYLGSSYMVGVIIAILILIFGINILSPSDADDSLYSVVDKAMVLPLDQQEPKPGSPINMCNKEANIFTNTNPDTGTSNITNQPLDVLKTIQTVSQNVSQNINMIGGKRKPLLPKQKLYNLKLV